MKWFEHQADARFNKKIRKIEKHFYDKYASYGYDGDDAAMAAVGRYWRLLEIIASEGKDADGVDTFSLPQDYDLDLLADDLRCGHEYLRDFLNLLAEINAIDPEAWQQGRIYCPKMAERADAYTKKAKLIRARKSAKTISQETKGNVQTDCKPTTDSVRTISGQCPDSVQTISPTQTQTQTQTQYTNTKKQKKESSRNPRPEDGDVGVTADPSLSGEFDSDQPTGGGNGRGRQGLTPNALAKLWNETADPVFPRVRLPLSDARARKLRPAIRERPDPDWWRSLIERANGVAFLRGDNDRGWRADLEFVVRRRDEILEGKYDRAKEDEPQWLKLISQDG